MKAALAEQMRQIDQKTQELFAMPGAILMERAALGVLEEIEQKFGSSFGKRVIVCCGKGNNGGDGLVIARLLVEKGAKVTGVLFFNREEYRALAQENLERAEKFGLRLIHWSEFNRIELQEADIIVDALLGTGAVGAPNGVLAEAITYINSLNKPVVAVDLPSGINVDNGQVDGVAVKATLTITFGLAKPGLLCYPGADFTGSLVVKQIGFPKQLLEAKELNINYLFSPEIREMLPLRQPSAHKGSTGHVLVVGGSPGMTGALTLASLGALRAGCGLVTAGVRMDLLFPEKPIEVIAVPWPDLIRRWDTFECIVFGPGLTAREDGETFLYTLLEQAKVPLVIDADGLNILATNKKLLKNLQQPIILTPHPGEMARLTGLTVSEIQADRIGVARRFASDWQVNLVLKGVRTVIATPDGQIYLNLTGNPGMATGGTGDVLAGVIGGLIAQGLPLTAAGVVGVFLHGLAGDLAANQYGMAGMIASDLLNEIPAAIKKVTIDEQVPKIN